MPASTSTSTIGGHPQVTGATAQSIDELVQMALGELKDIDNSESLDQWRVAY